MNCKHFAIVWWLLAAGQADLVHAKPAQKSYPVSSRYAFRDKQSNLGWLDSALDRAARAYDLSFRIPMRSVSGEHDGSQDSGQEI